MSYKDICQQQVKDDSAKKNQSKDKDDDDI